MVGDKRKDPKMGMCLAWTRHCKQATLADVESLRKKEVGFEGRGYQRRSGQTL